MLADERPDLLESSGRIKSDGFPYVRLNNSSTAFGEQA
jgi:hypothetical protein